MSSWLQKKAPFGESIMARFRTNLPIKDEVDIDVCLESFQAHWQQAWTRMQVHQNGTAVTMDEVNTVLNHTDQLRALVCWELEQQQQQRRPQQLEGEMEPPGRLAALFLSCSVPERLLEWSSRCGQFEPLLQSELLRVFEQVLRAGGGSLLEQRALLRPLTALLVRCRGAPAAEQSRRLVLVLGQLCRALQARPPLLDLFIELEPDGSVSGCVVFSLLVEFVHGDGVVGDTAREALLRCTRLSADSRPLAEFIVEHSDFCEVLATGLSGLYSALPRTPPTEDEELPEVDAFVGSLQFCNAVLQTCHPMVAAVLLELVYQGFLVSVMGPALHQSSTEAVVTATTYLELCVRSVDHPGLVRALVRLLLRHRHDGVLIIDTLVQRIAATPRLAVATLSLLHTLLNLNCEDVLLELVLRHLLPCSHLMVSQRSRVTETDVYGAGARRLLSLVPACCQPAAAADPRAAAAGWLQCVREARVALAACRAATRCWTYAYDGADPSPAEAERMARRRQSVASWLSLGAMGERGEADGDAGREETGSTPAAGSRVGVVPPGSSPVVHGWRVGRLQRTGNSLTVGVDHADGANQADGSNGTDREDQMDQVDLADQAGGAEGSCPDAPADEPRIPAEGGRRTSDNSCPSSTAGSLQSDPDPTDAAPSSDISSMAGDGDCGSNGTPASIRRWATPSAAPPPASAPGPTPAAAPEPYPELDLSEGDVDVWSTPQAPAGPSNTSHPGRSDSDKPSLGILSFLPDTESSSDTEVSSRGGGGGGGSGGETSSLRAAEVLGQEEVRRLSGAADVSVSSAEEAAVAFGECEDGDRRTRLAAPTFTVDDISVQSAEEEGRKPEDEAEAPTPSSDLSTFVERHSGTVREPPPPPPLSAQRTPPLGRQGAASDAATAVPTIGPFLLALLERLDLATTNTLQLNLLLMSVLSRLAHYPQPLLRSLLLNPTLVCQPSVRSLIQTLGSLKHRIDLATRSVQDAPGLVRWARARLETRQAAAVPAVVPAAAVVPVPASPTLGRTAAAHGPASGPASLPIYLGAAQSPVPAAAAADGEPGGFSLSGLAGRLRRALPAVSLTMETSDQPRRRTDDTRSPPAAVTDAMEWDASERRVALTAVLLEQWLAELAALALEHSVAIDRLVFTF